MMNDPEPSDRVEPHFNFPADPSLELALLGAILLDPPVMEQLDFVLPSDFYHEIHRDIFTRMRRLWDNGLPIDPVLVSDRNDELYSVCTQAFTTCPSSLFARDYARKLRDLAQKRGMIPTLNRAAELSMNGAGFEAVREFLLTELERDDRRSAYSGWQLRRAADLAVPPAPREWLLDGLIYRGQISMWYGPPGIRKSLLLMSMCASMAMSKNWLMRRFNQADHKSLVTFDATRPARILWLDYDNGEFETQIRIRAALTALEGLDKATFSYMSETIPWLALDNPSHARRIISLAKSMDADVIVFDALGMILGNVDENSPEAATVIARLKEIRAATGAAILCVHHPSKAGAQTATANTYNAAGSAKFSNFFEWTIELRSNEDLATIVAEVVKHRGWAKTTKFAAELEYTHFGLNQPALAHELETFRFYPAPLTGKREQRTTMIQSAILDTLSGDELNQSRLVHVVLSKLDEPTGDKTIRHTIRNMVEQGTIVARSTGDRRPVFYSLPMPVG